MGGHLGYSATRHDFTAWQTRMVTHLLAGYRLKGFTDFHHGDCVGGDLFAALIAYGLGYTVHCHPPENPVLRGWAPSHIVYPSLSYLQRNAVIANSAHEGLGVPNTEHMIDDTRSGTWMTIRRFDARNIPHWVITPTTWIRSPDHGRT